MKENLGRIYSIVNFDTTTKEMTILYECIPDLKQADLLAQLSMCNKQDYELIYITAGWNMSINKNEKYMEEYNEVLRLAEEYKAEEYIPF